MFGLAHSNGLWSCIPGNTLTLTPTSALEHALYLPSPHPGTHLPLTPPGRPHVWSGPQQRRAAAPAHRQLLPGGNRLQRRNLLQQQVSTAWSPVSHVLAGASCQPTRAGPNDSVQYPCTNCQIAVPSSSSRSSSSRSHLRSLARLDCEHTLASLALLLFLLQAGQGRHPRAGPDGQPAGGHAGGPGGGRQRSRQRSQPSTAAAHTPAHTGREHAKGRLI